MSTFAAPIVESLSVKKILWRYHPRTGALICALTHFRTSAEQSDSTLGIKDEAGVSMHERLLKTREKSFIQKRQNPRKQGSPSLKMMHTGKWRISH